MLTYKTREGDVVDEIVWRHYGTQNAAMIRETYKANPHLTEYGPLLPSGLSIVLPDIEQPSDKTGGVSLWD